LQDAWPRIGPTWCWSDPFLSLITSSSRTVFVRSLPADPSKGRRWMYSISSAVLGSYRVEPLPWIYEGRDWNAIALSVPDRWHAWSGASAVVIHGNTSVARLKGREKCSKAAKVREQLGSLEHCPVDSALSVRLSPVCRSRADAAESARISLPRIPHMGILHNWFGWWVAAAASTAVFALGHSIRGSKARWLLRLREPHDRDCGSSGFPVAMLWRYTRRLTSLRRTWTGSL